MSTFPNFEYAPGFDLLSLVMTTLSIPNSFSGRLSWRVNGVECRKFRSWLWYNWITKCISFGISVGATTNNVFVGYGPFKDEPRFGNSTKHSDHVVDFSSRGPTLIGDPKPDLMSIGA